jgi:hypothetical protein
MSYTSDEESQSNLRAIVESLEAAISNYDSDCRRIATKYGAAASTQPARDTLETTAADLASRYAEVHAKARGYARRQLGAQRRVWAESNDKLFFNTAIAAFAVLSPMLSDDAFISRFKDAIEDNIPNDALALAEVSRLRFSKPTAEVTDLQRQAFELGAAKPVRQAQKFVTYVDDLIARYETARASYESRVEAAKA